jgi:hypothetical protein
MSKRKVAVTLPQQTLSAVTSVQYLPLNEPQPFQDQLSSTTTYGGLAEKLVPNSAAPVSLEAPHHRRDEETC